MPSETNLLHQCRLATRDQYTQIAEMKRIKVLAVTFLTAFWFLLFHVRGHGPEIMQSGRPLCISQISLVNYACASLPPLPPKLSSSQPSDAIISPEHEDEQTGSPAEENCCRWLKNVDDACVCDLLVHLPSFLAKPAHDYSVIVGDTCKVNYHCGGRIF